MVIQKTDVWKVTLGQGNLEKIIFSLTYVAMAANFIPN